MKKNKLITLIALILGFITVTVLLMTVFPDNHNVWHAYEVLAVLAALTFYLPGAILGVVAAVAGGLFFTELDSGALINYVRLALIAGGVGWYASRNLSQEEHLSRLLMLDRLTGLRNYSYFIDRLQEERRRADRFGSRISLIMIDIDHFKPFNDKFGHRLGNELLIQMAAVFKAQVRGVDIVCRYGGEEFVILLPNTGTEAAHEIAERIRTTIDENDLPGTETLEKCSISAGVATYPNDAEDDLQLIDRADEAVHEAKQIGRNKVVVYNSSLTEKKAATP
ncbi:MAG TPA: GGDEF domain-containing protein [Actinobacteria bacterium]|nr:GGDEF domain-containing protein [Actinomycetota bacterium]